MNKNEVLEKLNDLEKSQLENIIKALSQKPEIFTITLDDILKNEKIDISYNRVYNDSEKYSILTIKVDKNESNWVVLDKEVDSTQDKKSVDYTYDVIKYVLGNREMDNFFSLFHKDYYKALEIGSVIKIPFKGKLIPYEVTKMELMKDFKGYKINSEAVEIARTFYLSNDGKDMKLDVFFGNNPVTGKKDKWIKPQKINTQVDNK